MHACILQVHGQITCSQGLMAVQLPPALEPTAPFLLRAAYASLKDSASAWLLSQRGTVDLSQQVDQITEPCCPRGSWSIAITSVFLIVSRSYADMFRILEPISRGAAIIAHSENSVRDCSLVAWTAAAGEEPRIASGSFQPPGPAYCARLFGPVTADRLMALPKAEFQSFTSYPKRQELPRELPTGAYQSLQPHSAK
jgi:hypothetical protein